MKDRRLIGRLRIGSGRIVALDANHFPVEDSEDGEVQEIPGALTIPLGRSGSFPTYIEYENGTPIRLVVQFV
ncbi:MAG: hypothetical protein ACE5H8_02985 [Alphaproteobacteria bacterium]